MDITTLGAALNGAKSQTESYVESHFVAGSNILITDNADGTQTISASGEVSAEDTVARGDIADHKADKANPHEVTKSQVGLGNVDNTSDINKPISTATQTALNGKVDVVIGKGLSTNDFTDTLKNKLDGIESGAEVNVQSDWTQTKTTADDYIKNKPSIPQTAADVGAIPTSAKGTASGVAELDSNGKVPSSQLPSYVDDVIEGYYYNSKFYKESAHTTEITGETGKIYIDLSGTNKTYRWSGSGYTEISESLALGETSSTAYRGDRGKTAYSHATETRLTTATASGLYKVASTAEGHIASLSSVQKSDITALGIPAQDTTYTPSTAAPAMDGTASPGTSEEYARADHVHPSDTSRASATAEAEDRAALVELVDSGAKNLLKLGFSKKIAINQTAEMTADGNGIVINGSRNSVTDTILVYDMVTNLNDGLDTRYTLPAGEYIMTKTGDANVRLQAYAHDGTNSIALGYTQVSDLHFEYTNEMKLQYPYLTFRIWVSRVSNFDNFTFYPMICTKTAWDISQAYQPYRPSYQELYERVVALEQANGITRSIQAAPTSTDNEEDMR